MGQKRVFYFLINVFKLKSELKRSTMHDGIWKNNIVTETIPDVARLIIKLSSTNYNDLIVQNFSQPGF